jgi:hypothetical protein
VDVASWTEHRVGGLDVAIQAELGVIPVRIWGSRLSIGLEVWMCGGPDCAGGEL